MALLVVLSLDVVVVVVVAVSLLSPPSPIILTPLCNSTSVP